MNYQYELSSTIYKILFSASEEYAKWLHDNGYRQIDSGKTFKMFNFSRLYIPQSKVIKGSDRIVILSQEVSFYISFLPDIGTEKLPNWIKNYTNKNITFEFTSGGDFPENLEKYKLIVHCGACMLTEREMKSRIALATEKQIPISNYGIIIAKINGILERATTPLHS